jgi:hypothetical protein
VETEGALWTRVDGDGTVTPDPKLPIECPRFYNDGGQIPGQQPCGAVDYRGARLPGVPLAPADRVSVPDLQPTACATGADVAVIAGQSLGPGSTYARLAAADLAEPNRVRWVTDLVSRTPEQSIKGETHVAIAAGLVIVRFVKDKQGLLQGRDPRDGTVRWQREVDAHARFAATARVLVVDGPSGLIALRPDDGVETGRLAGR